MTETALNGLQLQSSHADASSISSAKPELPLRMSPPPSYLPDLARGLLPLKDMPTLILGVQSDYLFPVDQQRELADALKMTGNKGVVYYELGGVWGHDTFLSVRFLCL